MLSIVCTLPGHLKAEIRDLNNDSLSQNLLNRNEENSKGSTEGFETSTILIGMYDLF